MKKIGVILLYLLSLTIPVTLYLLALGGGFDSYSLSVILGISAFIMVGNQFILASRPRFVVSAFGTKGILSFHGTMPVFILIFAGTHKILKEFNGFSDETLQGSLGGTVWWLFLAVTILTVLLMANTFWMKIKPLSSFKKWTYKKTGLNYKIMRVLHNITVVAAVLIMVHVLLASTGSFSDNPAGILWMIGWMILSLAMYLVYRLHGRTTGGVK